MSAGSPKPSRSASAAQVVPSKVSQSLSIPSSGLSTAPGWTEESPSSQSSTEDASPESSQSSSTDPTVFDAWPWPSPSPSLAQVVESQPSQSLSVESSGLSLAPGCTEASPSLQSPPPSKPPPLFT